MATQQFEHTLAARLMEQPVNSEGQLQPEPTVSPKGPILPGDTPACVDQSSGNNLSNSPNYTNDLPSPPSTLKTSPSILSPRYQKGRIISPPISRSASLNGKGVEHVEHWREFTRKQREQFLGEKAHMEADRARAEEVMAEERALWEKEREHYEGRIAELEAQLAALTGPSSQLSAATTAALSSVDISLKASMQQGQGNVSNPPTPKPLSRTVTQESGRNSDGSPFYAPAPQHPSRTFEGASTSDIRIDDMFTPLDAPIRVTSKLTESDFHRSPNSGVPFSPREDSVKGDSIDISLLQPELEGVPIRSSAVVPTFAAQVRSPSGASALVNQFSPDIAPPPRPAQSYDRQSPMQGPRKTREIIKQPEGRRLTMHAGHTPNHSVIHFELGESEVATPKSKSSMLGVESIATVIEQEEKPHEDPKDEDPELKGPLGLTNDAPGDMQFLAALTSKLEEVAESAEARRDSRESLEEQEISDAKMLRDALRAIGRGGGGIENDDDDEGGLVAAASTDDIPMLKLKQTPNFGRPLGSL